MKLKASASSTVILLFLTSFTIHAQTSSRQPVASYGKLPLSFEPNRGQADSAVQFISRGAGYSLFLTPASATFAFDSEVIRMDLIDSSPKAAMQPADKLPGITNYLMGSTHTRWPTNLPTYSRTRARGVYPGIDLTYYGTQGQLEYDFVVAPGADPSRIRLRFAGGVPAIDPRGDLVLLAKGAGHEEIRFRKPVMYQDAAGTRQTVEGSFTIASGSHEVGFRIGAYDPARELIVDPLLVYSSYLGGSTQQSVINGMTVNAAGEMYVTGITNSLNYPTTTGVIQPTCPAPMTGGAKCGPSSSSAAFVSKISADGSSLLYSTYLGGGGSGPGVGGSAYSAGGSGSDFGSAIAVDANDNAWVYGETNSNNFPVTPDAYSLYCEPASASFDFSSNQYVGEFANCARPGGGEFNYSGTYSLFLVELNPTGTSILYGTFLGGTQGETAGKIALDATGNIYLSGTANAGPVGSLASTGQFVFPTTPSAYQVSPQPNAQSAFVTAFSPDGKTLLYSSFLSATTGQVYGGPLAIGNGKVFIGGTAQTPLLPTTPGALSNTCIGSATQCPNNGFVAEFDPTLPGAASLVFSTYLNGTHVSSAGEGFDDSSVTALAADAAGNVYVGGSNQFTNFPTTPGVLQPTCYPGGDDFCNTGFVTKLSPSGSLIWSTFYGSPSGNGSYGVSAMALDSENDVYIANISDGAGDLPLNNGFQGYASGVAYITELSNDGSKVLFGSFFGSGSNIYPTALAVDASRNLYVAGYTAGLLPLANAYQSTTAGGFNEGFFTKIVGVPSSSVAPGVFVSSATGKVGAVASGSIVTVYGVDLATGTLSATLPLPTSLLGTTIDVIDSTGVSSPALLFFVSPGQVNFEIPAGIAPGIVSIVITSGDGAMSTGAVSITTVAPGLFLLNSSGLVAAETLTITASGAQVYGNVYQIVNGAVVPLPISVGPPAQEVFLVLYGTGIAGRSSLANVTVTIGSVSLPVTFAGPSGEAGLDQVNVVIPAAAAGSGDDTISIAVDGVVSNVAHITIM